MEIGMRWLLEKDILLDYEKLVGGGYLNEQTLLIGLTLTQRKCQLY